MFAPKSCLEFEAESKDEGKEINWHCIDLKVEIEALLIRYLKKSKKFIFLILITPQYYETLS